MTLVTLTGYVNGTEPHQVTVHAPDTASSALSVTLPYSMIVMEAETRLYRWSGPACLEPGATLILPAITTVSSS